MSNRRTMDHPLGHWCEITMSICLGLSLTKAKTLVYICYKKHYRPRLQFGLQNIWQTYEILVLISYAQNSPLYSRLGRGAKVLIYGLSLPLFLCVLYERSVCSDDTVRMRILVVAFAAHISHLITLV